jgi:C-terminal processing protease CtpA/Prc
LRDVNADTSREAVRAVLGRFVDKELVWQVRVDRNGTRVPDIAVPREPRAGKVPLVALIDRWTAAEGESLAAGFAAMGATLVGSRTTGFGAESGELRLPASGITVRFPVERVLLPDGTPREALRPSVSVDLAEPSGGPGDPILYQALKRLG